MRKSILFISAAVLFTCMARAGAGDAAEVPDPGVYSVIVVGDLYFGGGLQDRILKNGPDYPFIYVKDLLNSSDFTIGNLESPLSLAGGKYVKEKQFYLHADPRTADALLSGGFDLVSLANNHIMDYGPQALAETLRVLDERGIGRAGAGFNLSEARKPAFAEQNGRKIALLSYARVFPMEYYATSSRSGMAWAAAEYFAKDVQKARDAGAVLVVAAVHWSGELRNYPLPYQEEVGHALIQAGADLVVGHHPHVLQGIEIYRGKIIAYSLGNFAFSSMSKKVTDSAVFKIFWNGNHPEKLVIYPMNVANWETLYQTRPRTGADAERVLNDLRLFSAKYGTAITSEGDTGVIEIMLQP
ncbi:MAG: CapA family protein [Bacillota bacterium]